jgi:CRP-like cAMP-binding protein
MENPLKANKTKTKYFTKNIKRKVDHHNLFMLGKGQLIGEEDVVGNK